MFFALDVHSFLKSRHGSRGTQNFHPFAVRPAGGLHSRESRGHVRVRFVLGFFSVVTASQTPGRRPLPTPRCVRGARLVLNARVKTRKQARVLLTASSLVLWARWLPRCAPAAVVSFAHLGSTSAPVHFCVILRHFRTRVHPHATELRLLEARQEASLWSRTKPPLALGWPRAEGRTCPEQLPTAGCRPQPGAS